MKRLLATVCALVLLLGVSAAPAWAAGPCVTSADQGSCGPYDGYRQITGTTSSTYVNNDVWNPIAGASQTLTATSPGDWSVTADMPAGNGAVVSYPSTGGNYGQVTNTPSPLSGFSRIRSWFTETMNANPGTIAEAAYDIWLGNPGSSDWAYEVMLQTDFSALRPRCSSFQATATFNGQQWGLCTFGTELIWQLQGNEPSGVVHVLAMLRYLAANGYVPADVGLWAVGYGWEICSTGGQPETFSLSQFALHVRNT